MQSLHYILNNSYVEADLVWIRNSFKPLKTIKFEDKSRLLIYTLYIFRDDRQIKNQISSFSIGHSFIGHKWIIKATACNIFYSDYPILYLQF